MDSRQRWIALLLFVLSTGLYLLTRQRAIYGDGIFFESHLANGNLAYGQILYLPLVYAAWSCLGTVLDISAETVLKVVSALAGGAGVALTFLIACQTLTSTLRALAAALLLVGLSGYWFHSTATELHTVHAACALVLFLGLVHTLQAVQTAARIPRGTLSLLFLGTALTLASHTSGIAVLLPTLYVVTLTRRSSAARRQLLLGIGAGLLVFSACYLWLTSSHPAMQRYASDHSLKMFSVFTAPETLPPKTLGAARELLLYAVPASTLLPAGLRVLFHTAPGHAWLCLLWVIAWPLVVLPVGDFAFGSYHMPTLPVQAILAVTAWHGVATNVPRAILALALAVAPAAATLVGLQADLGRAAMDWSLAAWVPAAAALFWLAGNHTPNPRWLLALPVMSLVLSAAFLPPILGQDLIRDRIRAVAAAVGGQDLVLYATTDTVVHHHWKRFFPGSAVNLRMLDHDPALLAVLQSRAQEALDGKRSLWLVSDLENESGGTDFQRFRDLLRERFAKRSTDGLPESVYRLTPR